MAGTTILPLQSVEREETCVAATCSTDEVLSMRADYGEPAATIGLSSPDSKVLLVECTPACASTLAQCKALFPIAIPRRLNAAAAPPDGSCSKLWEPVGIWTERTSRSLAYFLALFLSHPAPESSRFMCPGRGQGRRGDRLDSHAAEVSRHVSRSSVRGFRKLR